MIKILQKKIKRLIFSFSSSQYWEKRYLKGGDSGYGMGVTSGDYDNDGCPECLQDCN